MKPPSGKETLSELQKYVSDMSIERGFREQSIYQQFMKFLEESGELAKAAKHQLKDPKNLAFQKESAHEAADVFMYLLELCNRLDVDLMKAMREKEKINENRSWK